MIVCVNVAVCERNAASVSVPFGVMEGVGVSVCVGDGVCVTVADGVNVSVGVAVGGGGKI